MLREHLEPLKKSIILLNAEIIFLLLEKGVEWRSVTKKKNVLRLWHRIDDDFTHVNMSETNKNTGMLYAMCSPK